MTMEYTVKQLADLAGVSRRTLHHYDEIGLLEPSMQGRNKYRYYNDQAVLRLQQILFYRELGFRLNEIKQALDQPDFDVVNTLALHKQSLQKRVERLEQLIGTVDNTINHLTGGIEMKSEEIFSGFSEEQQEEYAEQARQRWDPEVVDQSMNRWKNYSQEKQQAILAEGREIYQGIFDNIVAGHASSVVQDLIAQWHQNMRYFYEPTTAVLRGLGQMYVDSPDFRATFEKFSPEFPEFLNEAIKVYCEGKE
jgi:MerR family transcriptional regulator, thiopeptide resistance regulator